MKEKWLNSIIIQLLVTIKYQKIEKIYYDIRENKECIIHKCILQ